MVYYVEETTLLKILLILIDFNIQIKICIFEDESILNLIYY